MKEIHIDDQQQLESIIDTFNSDFPVVILEFRFVYGLMAANNIKGVEAINKIKKRLPNKFYGSFLGINESFKQIIHPNYLDQFNVISNAGEGAFLRFPIQNMKSPNQTCHNATHQVLIEYGRLKKAVEFIEKEYIKSVKTSDFFTSNFQSPLISSLNISGDIDGTITDKKHALDFGVKEKIPLFIHSDCLTFATESYPIFSYNEGGLLNLERRGVNDEEILNNLYKLSLHTNNLEI